MRRMFLSAAVCAALLFMISAGAQGDKTDKPAPLNDQLAPDLTDPILSDEQRQAEGKELWQQQCRHCHGRSAYPGKAPKLKPRRYEPDFVYDRITNGFRKMPAWKDVYTQQQRVNLVAFIMGGNFSP